MSQLTTFKSCHQFFLCAYISLCSIYGRLQPRTSHQVSESPRGFIKELSRFWLFFFFFNSVLRPFQDYFSSYEMGQSVGGAKTGEPREKPPGTVAHPQAELGLSHMWPEWGPNPHQAQRWDDRVLRNSALNSSATGAAVLTFVKHTDKPQSYLQLCCELCCELSCETVVRHSGKCLEDSNVTQTGPKTNSTERGGRASDSESSSPGFDPHRRHCVVSLSKTH